MVSTPVTPPPPPPATVFAYFEMRGGHFKLPVSAAPDYKRHREHGGLCKEIGWSRSMRGEWGYKGYAVLYGGDHEGVYGGRESAHSIIWGSQAHALHYISSTIDR